MDDSPSKSKRLLITGASRGIGAALAVEYLRRGWEVCGMSRTSPSPELFNHPRFRFERIDLADELSARQTVARLFDSIPCPHLTILNAGQLGLLDDLSQTTTADAEALMRLNVWANMWLINLAAEHQKLGQQVVGVSSGASQNGNRGFGVYSISKAALNMLIKLLAQEHFDCHFAALAPGIVDTEMQEQISISAESGRFQALEQLREKRQAGEIPAAEMIAPALVDSIAVLPERVESGSYADVREERFHDTYPRR